MKINGLLLATLLATSAVAVEEVNVTKESNTSEEVVSIDVNATQQSALMDEGVKYIKMLGGALKHELQKQMKLDASGLAGLNFCAARANEITVNVNSKLPSHASVRRTSIRPRNKAVNTPDENDIRIMEEFQATADNNTSTDKDFRMVEDGNITRVYKALYTKPVCLKCHGENVSKRLLHEISTFYPEDNATGFTLGSVRGVIVAEINTTK